MRPSETKPSVSENRLRTQLARWQQRHAVQRDLAAHYAAGPIKGVPEDKRRALLKDHREQAHRAAQEIRRRRRGLLWYAKHENPRDITTKTALTYAGKVTENPPGSNRGGIITTWETRLAGGGSWLVGAAWCGTFAANMLLEAGVTGVNSRLASVAFIEDDARAGRAPFTNWTLDRTRVKPGDLVVMFGRGIHVEVVLEAGPAYVHTVGGNTSSGTAGSQSNGGGVYERFRAYSDVHGFALVNYANATPGGAAA